MREIKLTIPDDDSAERTVRYVAHQLRDGQDLIVLDYSTVIPTSAMAAIVARLTAYIRVQEAKWNDHLEEMAAKIGVVQQ